MLNVSRLILVRGVALAAFAVALAACGQKGALYLPTGPQAANRATLPQTLRPDIGSSAASPATGAASAPSTAPGPGTATPIRTP